ncbi:hypothetical protein BJ508DRAFT_78917 [Ascobolus immersus RN42]|uniref:Uncharacterized protein n=1 Tax=Ascobolus immersus RN42 TaxID=1160509 RepID=A0A3N4IAL6_ASCIM|nr:hypothetical protein BJ508DRAFT_78917 [Ascobolus immersus RN42]
MITFVNPPGPSTPIDSTSRLSLWLAQGPRFKAFKLNFKFLQALFTHLTFITQRHSALSQSPWASIRVLRLLSLPNPPVKFTPSHLNNLYSFSFVLFFFPFTKKLFITYSNLNSQLTSPAFIETKLDFHPKFGSRQDIIDGCNNRSFETTSCNYRSTFYEPQIGAFHQHLEYDRL